MSTRYIATRIFYGVWLFSVPGSSICFAYDSAKESHGLSHESRRSLIMESA